MYSRNILNEAYKKAQKYTASENQSRPISYWLWRRDAFWYGVMICIMTKHAVSLFSQTAPRSILYRLHRIFYFVLYHRNCPWKFTSVYPLILTLAKRNFMYTELYGFHICISMHCAAVISTATSCSVARAACVALWKLHNSFHFSIHFAIVCHLNLYWRG